MEDLSIFSSTRIADKITNKKFTLLNKSLLSSSSRYKLITNHVKILKK